MILQYCFKSGPQGGVTGTYSATAGGGRLTVMYCSPYILEGVWRLSSLERVSSFRSRGQSLRRLSLLELVRLLQGSAATTCRPGKVCPLEILIS